MSTTLVVILSVVQSLIGLVVVAGGLSLLLSAVNGHRAYRFKRWLLIGLVGWGAWFGLIPFERQPDSLPSLAFGALIAYVLLKHGRRVSSVVSTNSW